MNDQVERLLAWERTLLQAESLDQWLGRVAVTPDDAPTRLLLADATHELRPLFCGDGTPDEEPATVAFVPSLAGVAPHLLAMHGAWIGEYHAADHALLLRGVGAPRRVAILPLRHGGQIAGVFAVATGDATTLFDGVPPSLLDHLADVIGASLGRQLDRARVLRGGLVDPLTGWNSPRYLFARLREEVARAQRERGSVACLVADVDRLQKINDESGYGAGDHALREIAARIESQLRASDTAARLGSDAFAVVLPATAAAQAGPLAERILSAVRGVPVEIGAGRTSPLSVSIGIAGRRPLPAHDRKVVSDQLLADASAAVFRAKQAGGDRYEVQPET